MRVIDCVICEREKSAQEVSDNKFFCKNCHSWFTIEPKTKEEEQKQDINWDLVEEKIKQTTGDRTNWKMILGKSLTKEVANLKFKGNKQDECFDIICKSSPLTEEQMRKLKIGIAARFGEIDSEMEERK